MNDIYLLGEGDYMRTILSEVEKGNITGLRELLQNGYNINEKDCFWGTPLHLAVNYEKHDIIALLLIEGADVNMVNIVGESPIFMISSDDINLFKLLLLHGADPNIKNNDGRTILDKAYEENLTDIIVLLKSYGAQGIINTGDFGLPD